MINDFYAQIGTERLLFFRLLILAIEQNYVEIIFTPRDLIERGLFKSWGFLVKISDGFTDTLIYYVRKPLLFYCGDGGVNQYGAIAKKLGWLCGIQSNKLRNIYDAWMIDNDWKKYNHSKHLEMIRRNKPLIATARDIEDISQLNEVLSQAEEISQYCGKVIIIPKCKVEIPSYYWLGFSVPTSHGNTTINPEWFNTHFVHLLGGSPKKQAFYAKHFNKLISLDGNYAMLAAKYGRVALNEDKTLSTTGCYEAFEISLLAQKKYWWGI
ncbi:DUF6610 family protein [Rivularia sp. UHCC 0363]|uniref:DUF6610 family protein n=1 Tax=Rivularia sp. UHCC 0363 TaxID=3110244 RepID=UPI002B20BC18|nr:DUF6610 family protein [Rivularia sp. UHCC 0363]MEA5595674.1 DUF6610 family protein [Rivularia sp. UHCC 0363]